jgi:hypothetical protein
MSDFQLVQQQFAAAIRDPAQALPAGVTQERMAVYQELFFNNVLNFVNSAFPVLTTLYLPSLWLAKVRLFFQTSKLPSPYFLDIAESFLDWLQQQPLDAADPPFLLELAHYEWIELYLATAHRQNDGPWLQQIENNQPLAVDELALLLSYQFPVSQISADFQPTQPTNEPSLLLVYRDPAQDIKFVALTQLSATVLQLLINAPGQSLVELTTTLQTLAPQLTNAALSAGAAQLLDELAKKGVIRAFQAA